MNHVRCSNCGVIFPSSIQESGTSIMVNCPSCGKPVDISRNQV